MPQGRALFGEDGQFGMLESDDNRCDTVDSGAMSVQLGHGAMSGNEVARLETRVAVRPHQSAAPGQGRHACLPLPWPPPGEMIRRLLWPPGWDR